MAQFLSGLSEPNGLDPEVPVRVTVPVEFGGLAMSELHSRRGCVRDMNVQQRTVSIRASLPASEYAGPENAIAVGTQNRGRVEHEPQTDLIDEMRQLHS